MPYRLAPVVEHYLEAMQEFCEENFGTTDLRVCRLRLKEAYKKLWE
jgi:hypothetical protein